MQFYNPGTILESSSYWKRELRTATAYIEDLQRLVIKLEEENRLLREERDRMKVSEKNEDSCNEIAPKKKKHDSRRTSTPTTDLGHVSPEEQV